MQTCCVPRTSRAPVGAALTWVRAGDSMSDVQAAATVLYTGDWSVAASYDGSAVGAQTGAVYRRQRGGMHSVVIQ